MVTAPHAAKTTAVECDTLVSSGCLIPLAVLDAVGPMDATLFIDQVDTEWGLRAQRQGLKLFGVPAAVLEHGIGESFVRPWFAPGRAVPIHSPVRDYYLVRNTIAVFFRRAAPWRWRLLQLVRLPGVMLVMVTQMPDRGERLRRILRGLRDGLLLRLGPAR
jgi:rhamnosyltransferase